MNMTWDEIKNEVSTLIDDAAYKSVRPMLQHLQSIALTEQTTPDVTEGLLRAVKGIQQDAEQPGESAREIANRAAGGFVQPDWKVDDVVNVNGDFKKIYLQFFGYNAEKLEEVVQAIKINIVPVVMTVVEAQELITGTIFNEFGDPVYKQEFDGLLELLEERKIVDWLERYGQKAEDWQPFNDTKATLDTLIKSTLASMQGYDKPLVPAYTDIRTLNDETRRRDLKMMRQRGCVVILDTISVRHPSLQRAYRRSLLDAFPETFIVRVAPVNDALGAVQQMIRFKETFDLSEFHQRFRFDRDGKCDEVSESFRFEYWLSNQIAKIVPPDQATGVRGYYDRT